MNEEADNAIRQLIDAARLVYEPLSSNVEPALKAMEDMMRSLVLERCIGPRVDTTLAYALFVRLN